jgi:hypothetical protein
MRMDGAKRLRERAARLLTTARETSIHSKKMALLQEGLRLIRRAEAMESSASAAAESGERSRTRA